MGMASQEQIKKQDELKRIDRLGIPEEESGRPDSAVEAAYGNTDSDEKTREAYKDLGQSTRSEGRGGANEAGGSAAFVRHLQELITGGRKDEVVALLRRATPDEHLRVRNEAILIPPLSELLGPDWLVSLGLVDVPSATPDTAAADPGVG